MLARSRLRIFFSEILVFLAFSALTAMLTWPYVNYLRDVVVDEGDPYLVSWIIWWDYHQTFSQPLQLFHANIFYPYSYTLAFSEHAYGISLLFFPLHALGLRPLTVHAVAMFIGFSFCGYGAFRLARTLTRSLTAAWIAGICFAFTPFRLEQMSLLPFLFTPWIPLSFEALILFARQTTWKRALWFGFACFMLGLSTLTWLTLSLVPMAFAILVLMTRYSLWNRREFWWRGGVALGMTSIALLPFLFPYYIVARTYGFTRSIQEVKENSAWPIHWLSIPPRSRLWSRMGPIVVPDSRFRLFPGLLPVIFSAVAIGRGRELKLQQTERTSESSATAKWTTWLDVLIVISLFLSVAALTFEGTNTGSGLFNYLKSEFVLSVLAFAVVARLCVAYPVFMRRKNANLVATLRTLSDDTVWLGLLLTVIGFSYSLGWNFFFYRICYDLLPIFRSMRVPTRGAMYAYLGLAILAGLGVQKFIDFLAKGRRNWLQRVTVLIIAGLLLLELNAAPLAIMRGDVFPDAVTLRLRDTPMRGGVVMLPAGSGYNHHHVLRAADHVKPLITATSGFIPPYEWAIENLTNSGPIPSEFLDLLETIPASYVVVMTHLVRPERRAIYENFFSRAVASGRLRFINRFDAHNDLYAVTKTEPEAKSESFLPFVMPQRDWSDAIAEDPLNLVSHDFEWTRAVYCMSLTAFGRMPRYQEFMADVTALSKGVVMGASVANPPLADRLLQLGKSFEQREEFKSLYREMPDEDFVGRVATNAGLPITQSDRAALADSMRNGNQSRASILLKIATDPRVQQREQNRSLVLVYFFAYLRRSPGDPPDLNLDGFLHWVSFLEAHGEGALTTAFTNSIERAQMLEREKAKR